MEVSCFSKNAGRLAVGEVDGRIKFVESETNQVIQEFTSNGNLRAACSCLAWQTPDSAREHQTSKKKVNKATNTVALGCVNGTIVVHDLTKSETVSRLEGGHTDRVTCLRWHPRCRNILFSGGEDSHIIEWNTTKCSILNRWKIDDQPVSAIELFESANERRMPANVVSSASENGTEVSETHDSSPSLWLATAGRKVKIWNVNNQQCVATLNAPASDVHLMQIIEYSNLKSTTHLLLTASKQERIVNLSLINAARFEETSTSSSKRKNVKLQPIGQLQAYGEVRTLDCVRIGSVLYAALVLQSGDLLVYEADDSVLLSADAAQQPWQRKSVKTVRFVATRKSKKAQLTIINCIVHAPSTQNVSLSIAYRTRFAHAIETVRYSELRNGVNVLEREERVPPAGFVSEADLFRLGAGAMTPPTSSASTSSSLSSTSDSSSIELVETEQTQSVKPPVTQKSDEETLRNRKRKAADIEVPEKKLEKKKRNELAPKDTPKQPPTNDTNSVVTVIVDALRKEDYVLLDSILRPNRTAASIRDVVAKLPATSLGALMRALLRNVRELKSKDIILRWLRATISIHAKRFDEQPAALHTLRTVRQLFLTRTHAYNHLLRLQGKLELVMDQIDRQRGPKKSSRQEQETVVFRDDSEAEDDLNSDDSNGVEDDDRELDGLSSNEELFDDDELERIAQQTSSQDEDDEDDTINHMDEDSEYSEIN